jgi:hypothetical protein
MALLQLPPQPVLQPLLPLRQPLLLRPPSPLPLVLRVARCALRAASRALRAACNKLRCRGELCHYRCCLWLLIFFLSKTVSSIDGTRVQSYTLLIRQISRSELQGAPGTQMRTIAQRLTTVTTTVTTTMTTTVWRRPRAQATLYRADRLELTGEKHGSGSGSILFFLDRRSRQKLAIANTHLVGDPSKAASQLK